MGIREKYAERKLRKAEKSEQRKPIIPNLDTIKKVAVIWQPEQKEAFLFLQDFFSKKQVIFRSLCIYNKPTEMATDANTLTPKDLGWLGFPKTGKVDSFIEMEFDLLVDICLIRNTTIDYITLITRAKFKTGCANKERFNFDLNINIGENKDALYLAKQQIFYLGELNKKTSK